MVGFGVFYFVYDFEEILMLCEWFGFRVFILFCFREIFLGLFEVNSGIVGCNNVSFLIY